MITRLAWKNIFRNKTRSTVFILAGLFGFALAVFALTLMKSISRQRLEDAINIETSYLQIHRKGYLEDKEVTLFIADAQDLLQKLERIENVEAVARRISTSAVVASPENGIACRVLGVLPAEENRLSVLKDFLVAGAYLPEGSKMPILVSKSTAERLHLKLKSKLVLTLKNTSGEIVGGAFRVAGIFATPSTPFDEGTVIVRYGDLAALAGTQEPHEIAIKLADPNGLETTKRGISAGLSPTYVLEDWKALLPELSAFDGFINMVGVLFTIIILLGLGFSLMNTMNMIVQERTREIGMLRAVGASKGRVVRLLLTESALLMGVGAAGGMILGILLVLLSSQVGIQISQGAGALGIRPTIYPQLEASVLVMVLVIATVLTLIIAAFPAARALSVQPSKALRE